MELGVTLGVYLFTEHCVPGPGQVAGDTHVEEQELPPRLTEVTGVQ